MIVAVLYVAGVFESIVTLYSIVIALFVDRDVRFVHIVVVVSFAYVHAVFSPAMHPGNSAPLFDPFTTEYWNEVLVAPGPPSSVVPFLSELKVTFTFMFPVLFIIIPLHASWARQSVNPFELLPLVLRFTIVNICVVEVPKDTLELIVQDMFSETFNTTVPAARPVSPCWFSLLMLISVPPRLITIAATSKRAKLLLDISIFISLILSNINLVILIFCLL